MGKKNQAGAKKLPFWENPKRKDFPRVKAGLGGQKNEKFPKIQIWKVIPMMGFPKEGILMAYISRSKTTLG